MVRVASLICLLCLGKAERPHYSPLFKETSLKKDLPRRISKLTGVPISQDNGYPSRVCRGCMDKFDSLERGLAKFQELVKTTVCPRECLGVHRRLVSTHIVHKKWLKCVYYTFFWTPSSSWMEQTLVKTSYSMLNRKRTKETSGNIGILPHTEKSRPPAKRSRGRCLSPDDTSK